MIYPWQQPNWQRISAQFAAGRYPHAILCQGTAGLGKHVFAQHLAAKILCDPQREYACGVCRSCRLWLAGSHPDYYTVMPEESGKAIKVSQIRTLTSALSQTAQCGGFQVVVLHPAEAMNAASSNALLKTLEEPQGCVVFILVAHQLATIPATILSRCQRLRFACPPQAAGLSWLLAQQVTADTNQVTLALRLASGAPLRAQTLLSSSDETRTLRCALPESLLCLLEQRITVSEVVESLLKHETVKVLHLLFSLAFDLLRLCLRLPESSLVNQDTIKQLHKLSDKVNLTALAEWLPKCLQTRHRLQTLPGINVQLALEALLVRWQQLRIT